MTANNGTAEVRVTQSDLPGLFQDSDAAANCSQKVYLFLVGGALVCIVGATLIEVLASIADNNRKWLALVGAVVFGASLALSIIVRLASYEKIWFDARAVAESVKTLSWRYMTGAEPYHIFLSLEIVETLFVCDLKAVIAERQKVTSHLAQDHEPKVQITEVMRSVRRLGTEGRRDVYRNSRIREQMKWYRVRSLTNRKIGSRWFLAIFAAEFLAICSAVAYAFYWNRVANLTGVFGGLAGALIAWIQLKRYQELCQSYGLAQQELGLIEAICDHISDDGQLSEYVLDSERAISREHTLWLARKTSP